MTIWDSVSSIKYFNRPYFQQKHPFNKTLSSRCVLLQSTFRLLHIVGNQNGERINFLMLFYCYYLLFPLTFCVDRCVVCVCATLAAQMSIKLMLCASVAIDSRVCSGLWDENKKMVEREEKSGNPAS